MLERAGVPATVLITEPFSAIIASHAVKLGAPGYHSLTVPHPVWGKGAEELQALVRPLATPALGQLTPEPQNPSGRTTDG